MSEIKQSKMKKTKMKELTKGVLREFIIIYLNQKETKMLGSDVEARFSQEFLWRSIVVSERKNLRTRSTLTYKIGLWSQNAAKHNYPLKIKALFPEVSSKDFEVQAIKGIGMWARLLTEKGFKVIFSSGEIEVEKLKQFSINAKKKVKLTKKIPTKRKISLNTNEKQTYDHKYPKRRKKLKKKGISLPSLGSKK